MVATGILRRSEKRALDPTCATPRELPRIPNRGENVLTLAVAVGLPDIVTRGIDGFFGVGFGGGGAGFGGGGGVGVGVGVGVGAGGVGGGGFGLVFVACAAFGFPCEALVLPVPGFPLPVFPPVT